MTVKLLPAPLLSIFRASAGMAEHVVRSAARTRLTLTTPSPAAPTVRLAAHANRLTLVLSGAIPAVPIAVAALVTLLELHRVMPSHAQLAGLTQQLPHLEEVALVGCHLHDLQQQPPAPHPPARFPSSVRALDVRSCRALWRSDRPYRQIPGLAALSLLQSPGNLRRLGADAAPGGNSVQLLFGLTHVTLRLCDSDDLGFLLRHPSLTHVTFHGLSTDTHWAAHSVPAMREGLRWEQLALVRGRHADVAAFPLDVLGRLVFKDSISGADAREWTDLAAAAEEAGCAVVCQPDAAGRFTITGGLQAWLEAAEQSFIERRCCDCLRSRECPGDCSAAAGPASLAVCRGAAVPLCLTPAGMQDRKKGKPVGVVEEGWAVHLPRA